LTKKKMMINPFKIEQKHIENLLGQNKPLEVLNFIFGLLKGEKKDNINLKLFSINHLNFIASEYFLVNGEELGFIKSLSKSEKLIKELKTFKTDNLKGMLLNFEASLHQSKFKYKFLKGENFQEILEKHLQLAISNYWRSLKIWEKEEEKYNIRNNLGNCLWATGRYIEAASLFNQNINTNPNRFQSYASWGHAMEKLKEKSILPDIPSFYFVLADKYIKSKKNATKKHIKDRLEMDIERCRLKLKSMDLELNEVNLNQNRTSAQSEFEQFSEYRKYVLINELSLNEHALHCHCANSEYDNLSIGLYSGSIHLTKLEKLKELERYLNRLKSEFIFARLLFYKYQMFNDNQNQFYSENDFKNTAVQNDDELLGYDVEHLRTSYRILYGLLDKIASAILVLYDIPENGKAVYFEDVFHQFKDDLSDKENIHLYALQSMSLDLNQSLDGVKVGSLGFYKKIRNKLEHGLLVLSNNETDLEIKEINILDFNSFITELLRLTKSAIFSLNFLMRTETIYEDLV